MHLEATGRLARTKPGVPLAFTLAAIAKRLDGHRATWFPEPDGHPVPVVSGIVSDRAWIAEAMGVSPGEVLERFQGAIERPIPWEELPTADAPVQEVVDRTPRLTEMLPIPTHNEHDAGAYITAGLVIAANPETGAQNLSLIHI